MVSDPMCLDIAVHNGICKYFPIQSYLINEQQSSAFSCCIEQFEQQKPRCKSIPSGGPNRFQL